MDKNYIKKPPFDVPTPPTTTMPNSYQIFQDTVVEMSGTLNRIAREHDLKNGLYYAALVDLIGSSLVHDKMNDEAQNSHWLDNFAQIAKEAHDFQHKDISVYIQTCGDGSLFLFRNFDDILQWKTRLDQICSYRNRELIEQKSYPYYTKIIVHLGEIDFNRDHHKDRHFVADVVFSIEKRFSKDDLGITEAVREALMPDIISGRFVTEQIGVHKNIDEIEFPLWKLFEKPI